VEGGGRKEISANFNDIKKTIVVFTYSYAVVSSLSPFYIAHFSKRIAPPFLISSSSTFPVEILLSVKIVQQKT
jgi:hypothetical protein